MGAHTHRLVISWVIILLVLLSLLLLLLLLLLLFVSSVFSNVSISNLPYICSFSQSTNPKNKINNQEKVFFTVMGVFLSFFAVFAAFLYPNRWVSSQRPVAKRTSTFFWPETRNDKCKIIGRTSNLFLPFTFFLLITRNDDTILLGEPKPFFWHE